MSEMFGVILVVMFLFLGGMAVGHYRAESKWAQREIEFTEKAEELRARNKELAYAHQQSQKNALISVEQMRKTYEARIADLDAEYTVRLRDSEERSEIYRERQCTASVGDTGLAEHAARLDTVVVEGRALVGELTAALRQCEITYERMSQYLLDDRSFLNEP